MRKFVVPLLMLIMLTLPFRGMAAMFMGAPVPDAAQATLSADPDHCAGMHENGADSKSDRSCAFCADCCTMAMTGPIAIDVAVADFHSRPIPILSTGHPGYLPEGPERPPKRFA